MPAAAALVRSGEADRRAADRHGFPGRRASPVRVVPSGGWLLVGAVRFRTARSAAASPTRRCRRGGGWSGGW